jgi:hypothetical protein
MLALAGLGWIALDHKYRSLVCMPPWLRQPMTPVIAIALWMRYSLIESKEVMVHGPSCDPVTACAPTRPQAGLR